MNRNRRWFIPLWSVVLLIPSCVLPPRPDLEALYSSYPPWVSGIGGYAWGTPIENIPGLVLLGGSIISSWSREYPVTQISSYFRPGDPSPYPGVDIINLQYLFCKVEPYGRVLLCGGVTEYSSEEQHVSRAGAINQPTQHRRLLTQLHRQLGMPEVQNLSGDRLTLVGNSLDATIPSSDTIPFRYVWCHSIKSPFRFGVCKPEVVSEFDPLWGVGHVLIASETLLDTVELVQHNSTVPYPLFNSIYGRRAWKLVSLTALINKINTNHLDIQPAVCDVNLASERALARSSGAQGRPAAHPISEGRYRYIQNYSEYRMDLVSRQYLKGYKEGAQYAYYEGHWHAGAMAERFRRAADADDPELQMIGVGYLDGIQLKTPVLPGGPFDRAAYERDLTIADSVCGHR